MFVGETLATGQAAGDAVRAAQLQENDLEFVRAHCVVDSAQEEEEEGWRARCSRGGKHYIYLTLILLILGLLVWYYL